jgi:hypothetical protein
MMKRVSLILILALLSLSCDAGSGPNGPRVRLSSEFMPLAIGNTWTYQETWYMENALFLTDTVTYTVTNRVSKAGKTYFEYMPTQDTAWLENAEWGFLNLDTFYFRTEEPGRVYSYREEGEQLYYDFNATFDSLRKVYLPIARVKDTTEIVVPAGRFTDCTILQGGVGGILVDVFAKGVGIVYRDVDGPNRRLLSAKVGGRSYP